MRGCGYCGKSARKAVYTDFAFEKIDWRRPDGGTAVARYHRPHAPRRQEGTGDHGIVHDLTNSQIALLCDIGEFDLPQLTSDQKRDLERLISGGYVGPTESHARSAFMLTAKGIEFLGKRGAGLNEA
jgi:hypothetical protein